ncbi:hypothetical protein Tco_1016122 [Tanacetum coccineum]|uniref:Uncharacterized protein n=1 Tax=Tanacetum coccineum TaxID=301880 RepID=A0ABQ5FQ52_9ASTR
MLVSHYTTISTATFTALWRPALVWIASSTLHLPVHETTDVVLKTYCFCPSQEVGRRETPDYFSTACDLSVIALVFLGRKFRRVSCSGSMADVAVCLPYAHGVSDYAPAREVSGLASAHWRCGSAMRAMYADPERGPGDCTRPGGQSESLLPEYLMPARAQSMDCLAIRYVRGRITLDYGLCSSSPRSLELQAADRRRSADALQICLKADHRSRDKLPEDGQVAVLRPGFMTVAMYSLLTSQQGLTPVADVYDLLFV